MRGGRYGFVLEAEEWRSCTYTCNPASLYQMSYTCIFFVARWPGTPPARDAAAAEATASPADVSGQPAGGDGAAPAQPQGGSRVSVSVG